MTAENPKYRDLRWSADENRWESAKRIIGTDRVTLGSTASQQWLRDPGHLAMVLSRYRAAAALIGNATDIVELGCGEGVGSRILIQDRAAYCGLDNDAEALNVAAELYRAGDVQFREVDILDFDQIPVTAGSWDAVVSLDVLEHIPAEREADFMRTVTGLLDPIGGLAVIGTPNARFFDLASPQSRIGHINNYDHARLYALMLQHFWTVQSFGMNDVSLHAGHPEARHYLMMCGIGLRSS